MYVRYVRSISTSSTGIIYSNIIINIIIVIIIYSSINSSTGIINSNYTLSFYSTVLYLFIFLNINVLMSY